jgi:hypothetical protein
MVGMTELVPVLGHFNFSKSASTPARRSGTNNKISHQSNNAFESEIALALTLGNSG